MLLRLESPLPGERVVGYVHQARIAGSALADAADPRAFDVMLAIDVSYSTRVASGGDVDGDGVVGLDPVAEGMGGLLPADVRSTDLDDTILRAQVRAAQTLLEDLDARRVRVGVIAFSGDVDPATGERVSETQQDAHVVTPLTSDYARVRSALAAVVARGPNGATNFGAGILLAVTELSGLSGAQSQARADAKKIVLFLTDGLPTEVAGAVVSGSTFEQAERKRLNLPRALALHDTYPVLKTLKSHLVTGPTGTNVNDLYLFLAL